MWSGPHGEKVVKEGLQSSFLSSNSPLFAAPMLALHTARGGGGGEACLVAAILIC